MSSQQWSRILACALLLPTLVLPGVEAQAVTPLILDCPDGMVVFQRDYDPHFAIFGRCPATGQEVKLADGPGRDLRAALSPDGRRLIWTNGNTGTWRLLAKDLIAGTETVVLDQGVADDWSPSGGQLAFSKSPNNLYNWDVWVLDLLTGQARQLTTSGSAGRSTGGARWSADGAALFYNVEESPDRLDIYRVPASGGTPTRLTTFANSGLSASNPRPSPDGRVLAFTVHGNGTSQIWIHDLATGQNFMTRIGTLHSGGCCPAGFDWSPNGLGFVVARADGQLVFYDLYSQLATPFTTGDGPVWGPARTDGAITRDRVSSEGNATRRAITEDGDSTRQLVGDEADAIRETVVSDGNLTRARLETEEQSTRGAVRIEGNETRALMNGTAEQISVEIVADGARTRSADRADGDHTRSDLRAEGVSIRENVSQEGESTRESVSQEGESTRETVRTEARGILGFLERFADWLREAVAALHARADAGFAQSEGEHAGLASDHDAILSTLGAESDTTALDITVTPGSTPGDSYVLITLRGSATDAEVTLTIDGARPAGLMPDRVATGVYHIRAVDGEPSPKERVLVVAVRNSTHQGTTIIILPPAVGTNATAPPAPEAPEPPTGPAPGQYSTTVLFENVTELESKSFSTPAVDAPLLGLKAREGADGRKQLVFSVAGQEVGALNVPEGAPVEGLDINLLSVSGTDTRVPGGSVEIRVSYRDQAGGQRCTVADDRRCVSTPFVVDDPGDALWPVTAGPDASLVIEATLRDDTREPILAQTIEVPLAGQALGWGHASLPEQ